MKWTGNEASVRRDPAYAYVPWWAVNLTLYTLAAVGLSMGAYAIVSNLHRLPGWFPAVALAMLAVTIATILYARLVIPRRVRAAAARKETA